MLAYPQHDSVVGIFVVCNHNFISSPCKELGLCGLAEEKINVIYQNSSEKIFWQLTEALIHDCSKLVNKLTYNNLDNNIHLLSWLWSMPLLKVMPKFVLSFDIIKIHCLHYMKVINTLLVFISFHESPVHSTAHRMISYLSFSENKAKTLYVIFWT